MTHPIAVVASDIHLQPKPPRYRSNEKDWLEVQRNYIWQMADIAGKLPIIIAGDLFDRHNPPVEFVNWAVGVFRQIGDVYCIPGQHDLPNHRYSDRLKSAYGTLVLADVITDLWQPLNISDELRVYPYPWEEEIQPLPYDTTDRVTLAVIHAYLWKAGASYPGAPESSNVGKYRDILSGYDAAVFGDNHKPFDDTGSCYIFNCGGFMIRKSDDNHRPRVGKLMSDGSIETYDLDTSKDVYLPEDHTFKPEQTRIDFLDGISDIERPDFEEYVTRRMRDVETPIRDEMTSIIEEAKG